MFSRDQFDKVPYFGQWADDAAEDRLVRDALAVLRDAAGRCADQDVRTDELAAALAFLERRLVRPALCSTFRTALDLRDPLARYNAVRAAYNAIARAVGTVPVCCG